MFKLINLIKINEINKNKKIILKNNFKKTNFLKIMIKLNIIKYIIKLNKKIIFILNFLKNNKLLFNIKNLFKKSNLKYIKYKNFLKLNKKNNIIILSTNKGLLTNNDIKKNKIGGIIISILWN